MNKSKFAPLFFAIAILVSACSGILPEPVNIPPAQAVQACGVGNPDAVIVGGKKYDCDDVKNAMATLGAPPVSGPAATSAPGPTATAARGYVAPTTAPSGECRDGEVIGNDLNIIQRTPVGLAENNSVLEVSWKPGSGFGRYDRSNVIVPAEGNTVQVFLKNVETIHTTRYCGTLEQVVAYVGSPETESGMPPHVRSMRQTAAAAGGAPDPKEIPVVVVDLTTGDLTVLWNAPKGPTIEEIKTHLEVVPVTP